MPSPFVLYINILPKFAIYRVRYIAFLSFLWYNVGYIAIKVEGINMNCTFFGHRNTTADIRNALEAEIICLINKGVKSFYVGNNGNFDYLVQDVLKHLSLLYKNINFTVVLSRIDETVVACEQAFSIFPYELESSLPKFAISKRNEWLIRNCDIAIVYAKDKLSNAHKWAQKAQSHGLLVINLYE